jgi:hypothetical protein
LAHLIAPIIFRFSPIVIFWIFINFNGCCLWSYILSRANYRLEVARSDTELNGDVIAMSRYYREIDLVILSVQGAFLLLGVYVGFYSPPSRNQAIGNALLFSATFIYGEICFLYLGLRKLILDRRIRMDKYAKLRKDAEDDSKHSSSDGAS